MVKSKNFKWLFGERVWWLKVLIGEGFKDLNLVYFFIFCVGEKIVVVVIGRMWKKWWGEKCWYFRWIVVWDGKIIYVFILVIRLLFSW